MAHNLKIYSNDPNDESYDIYANGVFKINVPISYAITKTIINGSASGATSINKGASATITLTPNTYYYLPSTITVNGVTGSSGSTGVTWTYNSTTGQISLSAPSAAITIAAEMEMPQLDAPANVAISGTEVTFDKVENAEQYEFYVDDSSIGSYTALPSPKSSLSDYTWAEIKVLADAVANNDISSSDLSNTYNISIGDTKASTINGESHNYRLIGINHDVDASDNTVGMTFKQVDLMANTYVMKSSMTQIDSWQNSNLKTTLEGFAVASDLAAVITPVKKVCANNVSSGTPTYNYVNNTNGLWIESETEVFGTQNETIDYTVEGSQYEWYANGGSKIAQGNSLSYYGWLRSPCMWNEEYAESYFAIFWSDGNVDDNYSYQDAAVVPCFCI